MQHLDIAERGLPTCHAALASGGRPTTDRRDGDPPGGASLHTPERDDFHPYARTYANWEVYHFLRDKGFLIKVPASWRELHAHGLKLLRLGVDPTEIPNRLGVSAERWREMVLACSQRVVAYEVEDD